MSPTTRQMSDRHEEDLVERLGGRLNPGSGNQWHRPMDGRHSRYAASIAWAWDGKSTLNEGTRVTRKMWAKAIEQAGGERPMLALRFYASERLDVEYDLVILGLDDFEELLWMVEEMSQARDSLEVLVEGLVKEMDRHENGHAMVDRLIALFDQAGLAERVPDHAHREAIRG